MTGITVKNRNARGRVRAYIADIMKHWQMLLILLLPIVYLVVFQYLPLLGNVLAFKNYSPSKGIWGSNWAGLKYFQQIFRVPSIMTYAGNTLKISLLSIVLEFPFPILLALSLEQLKRKRAKKYIQTITYAPYFISTVVMVSLITQFLDTNSGIISNGLALLTGKRINYLGYASYFPWVYVISQVWQFTGFNAILYIAALTNIDPQIREAAMIDGAGRFKLMLYVDIPELIPTACTLLILRVGKAMSVGFEKVYLMQNDMNIKASEILSTYVYKTGLVDVNFSFAAAVDLCNAVINVTLLLLANWIIKRVGENGIL